jgi:FAD/FMN-containing dehydrogenase
MRGGGAGSWGVIVSATFRAYPTFNSTYATITLDLSNATSADFGAVMTAHAAHIFDLDGFQASHYFYTGGDAATGTFNLALRAWIPYATAAESKSALQPMLEDILAIDANITLSVETYEEKIFNDAIFIEADEYYGIMFLGSRLVPEAAYSEPEKIGKMFEKLYDAGSKR